MNPFDSIHFRSSHPLSGLEAWPTTGPVYGLAEDEGEPRSVSVWQRIGDRLRRAPPAQEARVPQARIWY